MRVERRIGVVVVCAFLFAGAAAPAAIVTGSATHPLVTGVIDEANFSGPNSAADMADVSDLGGTTVRLRLNWADVVTGGSTRPSPFDATDPNDPNYDWRSFDTEVENAVAAGLTPIVNFFTAPDWALGGSGLPSTIPNPTEFGEFALAAARRYSGSTPGIPRVSEWEIWDEPDLGLYVEPQFVSGEPYSPGWYRTFLNAAYDSLKSVHADNIVIAGSTAPFYDTTPSTYAEDTDWGPLSFLRDVVCLSDTLQPTPGCTTQAKFDIWATHPYTEGSPEHRAALPNDVSIPDLPKMRAVLDAAEADDHIMSSGPVQLAATEFSWVSSPPVSGGVPMSTMVRWVPQSLYDMWESGVSLVTWFTLLDDPNADRFESGLLFADGSATPFSQAFAFPVVGISHRNQLEVWGRTPGGQPRVDVTIQQSVSGSVDTLGTVSSDANGIFQARFTAEPVGSIQALAPSLDQQSDEYPLGADPDVNTVVPAFAGPYLEAAPEWGRPSVPAPAAGGTSLRISVEQRIRAGEAP